MATRDSGGQQRASRARQQSEDTEVKTGEDVKERHDAISDDVDNILDEIDEVLEENAEEFVKSFVQKGGQ